MNSLLTTLLTAGILICAWLWHDNPPLCRTRNSILAHTNSLDVPLRTANPNRLVAYEAS